MALESEEILDAKVRAVVPGEAAGEIRGGRLERAWDTAFGSVASMAWYQEGPVGDDSGGKMGGHWNGEAVASHPGLAASTSLFSSFKGHSFFEGCLRQLGWLQLNT